MLPTPDTSHLTKEDLEHVYDPAGMRCDSCEPESENIMTQRAFLSALLALRGYIHLT